MPRRDYTGLKEAEMCWSDVRERYPDQWLVVEATEAHSEGDRRFVDRLAVVELCPDGEAAMQTYRRLHRLHPDRELYFVHTSRPELTITERHWAGIRGTYEVAA
jgi:hypothetical protein